MNASLETLGTQPAHLDWAAREYGMAAPYLLRIFELETAFHKRILSTRDAKARKEEYRLLYSEVHRLEQLGSTAEGEKTDRTCLERLVQAFSRELAGKSVLDVGCGSGAFLQILHALLPHGQLCGLDTSPVSLPGHESSIRFLQMDIVEFALPEQFDVVFSHQVLEHIAPSDVSSHLKSVHAALKKNGKFLVFLPNRYWGPQDITRIVDNTFTGRVPAQGSHVNESSYSELIPELEKHGFKKIRTTIPLGTFLPMLRGVRVRPSFNQFIERHSGTRKLLNMLRVHGRPVFKNPIVLVCEKQ